MKRSRLKLKMLSAKLRNKVPPTCNVDVFGWPLHEDEKPRLRTSWSKSKKKWVVQ